METNIREYDVYIVTKNHKVFIGNVFTTSPQQAKMKALALNSSKDYLQELITNQTEYSVLVELNKTSAIFK